MLSVNGDLNVVCKKDFSIGDARFEMGEVVKVSIDEFGYFTIPARCWGADLSNPKRRIGVCGKMREFDFFEHFEVLGPIVDDWSVAFMTEVERVTSRKAS